MSDAELLADLAPTAAALLDRHAAAARTWFPHQLVPWGDGRDLATTEPFDEAKARLPRGVRSALILNLLTEDNLPFYVTALHDCLGSAPPWGTWIRRWAAEEMRHAIVIHDYLAVTKSVDLDALEENRFAQVSIGPVPTAPTALEALVYVTLQEMATRVAHGNTGRALPDPAGRAIMRRVAADENLHHLFYRDVVTVALRRHPDATVLAIEAQARHFAMPGIGIPAFQDHAAAIAHAGIYSAATLHHQVLVPVLLGHWRLDQVGGLGPAAEAARQRILRFLDRMGRLADRLDVGATAPSS